MDWSISSEFRALKAQLNEVKARLNRLALDQWHRHTRRTNPAGQVIQAVRNVGRNPELLTQAWCKFTEIMSQFPSLVPSQSRRTSPFTTAHLCEAPGAFVAALNHYLHTQHSPGHPVDWHWRATTLNPFHEGNGTASMINDDRFILQTLDHWHFGRDLTGDILEPRNRKCIHETWTQQLGGKVDLVTADGSIDCQSDPGEQERIVTPLHVAETCLALNLLREGGNFVIKMFTLFELGSLALLFVLHRCFRELSVYKPATSKEGNSEVYVIALGYRDNLNPNDRAFLMDLKPSSEYPLIPIDAIDPQFVSEVYSCARFFKEIQSEVIVKNLNTFQQPFNASAFMKIQRQVSQEYLNKCQIAPMNDQHRLTQNLPRAQSCLHMGTKREWGTFEDRLSRSRLDPEVLNERLQQMEAPRGHLHHVKWIDSIVLDTSHLTPFYGRSFHRVESSKFCLCESLEVFYDTLELESKIDGTKSDLKRRKIASTKSSLKSQLSAILSDSENENPTPINVDFSTILCQGETSKSFGPDTLKELTAKLSILKSGQCLALNHCLGLTRVDVAILLLVASCFTKMGFLAHPKISGIIFFSGFTAAENRQPILKLLESIPIWMSSCAKDKNTELVALCEVTHLLHEPFYSDLVNYNMLSLFHWSKQTLSSLTNVADRSPGGE